MSTVNLLYRRTYPINDKIHVIVPSVGEILDDEDAYYELLSMMTAMPIDLMVQLDDIGIDFSKINEYELFLLMFQGLATQDTSLIFDRLDLTKFRMDVNEDSKMVVLRDDENDIVIDRLIHSQIAGALRKIHNLEKNIRKPGNDEAKRFLLERARAKQKRRKNRKQDSQLESLIVAMVNAPEYKYDYEETRELSIYQFNQSVRQIIHRVDYDHKMQGVYGGTIDAKSLSTDELNWLAYKK